MRIVIKFLFKIIAIILYRPKVIGKENIPENSATIICANHVHFIDSAVMIAMTKRKVNILAKEELFKGRIGRWFARLFGIFPVKRDHKDIQAVKISLNLLKNNELLAIFPEGTRNGIKKGIKPKNGPVLIAIKAKVPIIPLGIQGNFKPFRKTILNYGKPIYYNEYEKEIKNKEVIDELTNSIMKEIICLRDEGEKK